MTILTSSASIAEIKLGMDKPIKLKSDFEKAAYLRIKRDLNQFTKILTRDIYVYHWAPLATMGISESSLMYPLKYEEAKYHLEKRLKMFRKDYRKTESGMGNGLYGAINPSASSWYGGEEFTPWGMIQIKIPAGSKFLDVRLGYDKILISERTYNFLYDTCKLENDDSGQHVINGKNYVGVHKIAFTKKKKCRKAFLKAFDDSRINFLTYLWVENKNYKTLCDRTDGPYDNKGSSILMIDVDLHIKNFNFFSQGISGVRRNPNVFNHYKEFHDTMRLAKAGLTSSDHGIWDFFDLYPQTIGLEDKLKNNTFTCSKKYSEDNIVK